MREIGLWLDVDYCIGMHGFRILLGGALVLLLLQGCAPELPRCRIASGMAHAAEGNAGCLIEQHKRMLVIRHRINGKLGVPAGSGEDDESAQCTAHRETWEEAGVDVQVGELLWSYPENDFFLFACYLGDQLGESSTRDASEVIDVFWLDPHGIDPSEWRFPEQWAQVLDAFERLPSHNTR